MVSKRAAVEDRLQELKEFVDTCIKKGWSTGLWVPKEDGTQPQITEYDIILISSYCEALGLKASRGSLQTNCQKTGKTCAAWGLILTPIQETPLKEDGISVSVEDFKLLRFARSNIFCKIIYKLFANKS